MLLRVYFYVLCACDFPDASKSPSTSVKVLSCDCEGESPACEVPSFSEAEDPSSSSDVFVAGAGSNVFKDTSCGHA